MIAPSTRRRIGDVLLFVDNLLADGFVLIVGVIFFAAKAQGNQVTVTINDYGEAGVEAVLLPLVFAVALAGTAVRLKRGFDRAR
jgi:hypothetical protein